MTTEQILAMLTNITAQLQAIGEQIERLGESLTQPVHLHFQGEDIIEVHTATGIQYRRASDLTPISPEMRAHQAMIATMLQNGQVMKDAQEWELKKDK